MLSNIKQIEVKHLKKYFPVQKGIIKRTIGYVRAVDDISFYIAQGETLGLVGESGCGKTTVGRTILRLIEPTDGEIWFRTGATVGKEEEDKLIDVTSASNKKLKDLRCEMQIIFQDPYSSLDPRKNVEWIVGEPFKIHSSIKGGERENRIDELLTAVGLRPEYKNRYPHEFSGGQRQRIGIARALALNPKLIIADEPVSALDVSIQAQVINLLKDLQVKYHLTFLFIAHDLSIVKYVSDRVAVMYLGKIMELAVTEELFGNPMHPYTEALISAVPVPDPEHNLDQIILKGDVPSPMDSIKGCCFNLRCNYAQTICECEVPIYRDIGGDHFVACHFAGNIKLRSYKEFL